MTEDQIKYMVDRFLDWRLPETFKPTNGISFRFPDGIHMPSGTNLFDADEAEAMVRRMLDGLPVGDDCKIMPKRPGSPVGDVVGEFIGKAAGAVFRGVLFGCGLWLAISLLGMPS